MSRDRQGAVVSRCRTALPHGRGSKTSQPLRIEHDSDSAVAFDETKERRGHRCGCVIISFCRRFVLDASSRACWMAGLVARRDLPGVDAERPRLEGGLSTMATVANRDPSRLESAELRSVAIEELAGTFEDAVHVPPVSRRR